MSQPGDLTVVHFLTDQPLGTRFNNKRNDWPLHLTLLSWFEATDENIAIQVLEFSARYSPALPITIGEDTDFSPATHVSVIAEQEGVAMLHSALLATLEEAGARVKDTRWAGESYKAHVTHQELQPVPQTGATLLLKQFSLVSLLPGAVCEVIRHFHLGANV